MYWLKACTRCGGDLFQNRDEYGQYIACAQCGTYLSEADEPGVGLAAGREVLRYPVGTRVESAAG